MAPHSGATPQLTSTQALEADGTIKGCPSLPTTSYSGGNVRDRSVRDIWTSTPELSFARADRTAELWGFCRGCYYARVCQAGCTWTSHSLVGKPGNNPYCHYRALELDARGMRERVVRRLPAPGTPFDHGEFDVVCEPTGRPARAAAHPNGPPVPMADHDGTLVLCYTCCCYVYSGTSQCPHCGADVEASQRKHEKALADSKSAAARLAVALNMLGAGDSAE
ncbi:SPASM domain-containing protein [Nocardia amamiensis]|uniref:SPASM domain-containing protein n=1 Tax=Nocardia amamiensis TaxID=404578 RepID=A0ABS0D242_9NOCA|nr:SPASM domain-containing protein [Nocardia amamiensis]